MKKIFLVLIVFIFSCQKPAELIDSKFEYDIFATDKTSLHCRVNNTTFESQKVCECADKLQNSFYSILPSKLTGLEKNEANKNLLLKYWEQQFIKNCSFDYSQKK